MGDYRTTAGDGLPATPVERQHRLRKWLLIGGCALLALIALGMVVPVPRYTLATGYVTTIDYAEVRPPVTGIVHRILVKSGQTVKAGQVMVELNSQEEESLLSEAKARVSKLKTEMERRQAEMSIDLERRTVDLEEKKRNHRNELEVADLELKNRQAKLEQTRKLVEKGLKASSYLIDDTLQVKLADVTLKSLQDKNFKIYEELLVRDKAKYAREMDALKNELAAQEDMVKRMEARVEMRKIRAPIAGQVVRYEFVVGELLQPTGVIYEIFGGDRQVLKLRVGERHATRLAVGQRYRAELNSVREGVLSTYFRGKVEALRNVIQSEGQTTYRVAYCSFDAQGREIPPGTTAEARIYYGHSNLWYYLLNIDP